MSLNHSASLPYGHIFVWFSTGEIFSNSEVILIYLDFTSLANCMYYCSLYPKGDLVTQFMMLSGFTYLRPKLGCSWGFQLLSIHLTVLWCIFNVKIPQWWKQSFPSFQRYSQDTLNESCSVQHELLFFFYITWGNVYTIPPLPSLQRWPWMGSIFFTGYVPNAKPFWAFLLY